MTEEKLKCSRVGIYKFLKWSISTERCCSRRWAAESTIVSKYDHSVRITLYFNTKRSHLLSNGRDLCYVTLPYLISNNLAIVCTTIVERKRDVNFLLTRLKVLLSCSAALSLFWSLQCLRNWKKKKKKKMNFLLQLFLFANSITFNFCMHDVSRLKLPHSGGVTSLLILTSEFNICVLDRMYIFMSPSGCETSRWWPLMSICMLLSVSLYFPLTVK